MNREELNSILRLHKAWLIGKEFGERADLHGADLHHARLQDADLQGAILRHSILEDSDLQGAILRQSDLRQSDLRQSDLQSAILEDSELQGADLRGALLQHSNLRGAGLRHCDLRGADLDYASWPLWCGSLKAYVDDRIAIQLLYHTLSVVQHSPYVSDEVKAKLLTPEIVSLANRFHRVGECMKIKEWEEGQNDLQREETP